MADNTERAFLAGGCFWITQQLLRQRAGVFSTRVGWMGGEGANPTETSNGGHAEAVEVLFDPDRLSYRELLEFFFIVHRADLGQDIVGTIYRSEIFYINEAQRMVAMETIRAVDASGHWPARVATRLSKVGPFLVETPRNQDYLQRLQLGCPAPFRRCGEQAGAKQVNSCDRRSDPRRGQRIAISESRHAAIVPNYHF